jgi:hypothetical protein
MNMELPKYTDEEKRDIMNRFMEEAFSTVSILSMTALATYDKAVIMIDKDLNVKDITEEYLKED